jgi:hypothetical protein
MHALEWPHNIVTAFLDRCAAESSAFADVVAAICCSRRRLALKGLLTMGRTMQMRSQSRRT